MRDLITSKVLDVRHQGAPTEAYKQYATRRNDRPSSAVACYGGWKGNAADDTLMVDQGYPVVLDTGTAFL